MHLSLSLNTKFMYQVLILSVLILLGACSTQQKKQNPTLEQRLNISFDPLSEWVERKFVGSSKYQIKQENGETILTANSKHSASLLYKKINVDLNQTPYLNWQWLVEQTYTNIGDEHTKQSDDFPARIYIAIKPKLGHIQPRALTYVWASHAEQFSHWKNPFSKNVTVMAVESGNRLTGKWLTEKRNLKQDLNTLFGQEISAIEGIGVMTDSDNSKTVGKAAYANLFFSRD